MIDPCTFDVHNFGYKGGGLGFGFGGAFTAEVGYVDLDNPLDFSGRGIGVGGFAAAIHGATGQYSTPDDLSFDYNAGTLGYAGGAGWGVSGLWTKTNYWGTNKFSDLPQKVQDLLGPVKPKCEDSCGE